MKLKSIRTAIAGAAAVGIVAAAGGAVSASETSDFPPPDERCKVPPALFQVAAVVDVDSLEGCGFFEDPNYFENRKANGSYNPNGVFSTIFG